MRPLLVPLLMAACAHPAPPSPATPRGVTLISINDVYRIDGLPELDLGGLDRLRALRARLEAETGQPVLITHAGDALFPALLSKTFDGAQMIDVLNHMDGDAAAFDRWMVLVPGNHEFDKGRCKDAPMLARRIAESGFSWVASNIAWGPRPGSGCAPETQPSAATSAVLELGGLRIGVIGLTTDARHPDYVTSFADPVATARERTAALRAEGADVVLAVTHQLVADDLALMEALGDAGPDLVLGGHEHTRQRHEVDGRLLLKADADLRSAVVARITVDDGGVRVAAEHVDMDASQPRDPAVRAVIDGWTARHAEGWCGALGLPPTCLSDVVGTTRTDLIGEEVRVRTTETTLGDWASDAALAAFAPHGAQVAVVHSGSLRLNRDLPAGTAITRMHLEELLPYASDLTLVEVPGATLRAMLARSIEDWTGNGHWLQVAGLRFVHDPDREEVRDVVLADGAGGWRPLDDAARVRIALPVYLTDPDAGDQDGYTMVGPADRVPGIAPVLLKELLLASLQRAGEAGISPTTDGRVCNTRLDRCGP